MDRARQTRLGRHRRLPLVLASSCVDFDSINRAGDSADGIYFVGATGGLLSPLDGPEGGRARRCTDVSNESKCVRHERRRRLQVVRKLGFRDDDEHLDHSEHCRRRSHGPARFPDAVAASDGTTRAFGGTPLDCAGAPEPYISICSPTVGVTMWNGEELTTVIDEFSGIGLLAGTALRTELSNEADRRRTCGHRPHSG